MESLEPGNLIPPGIWTLADVLNYGREKGVCPYFTIRRMVSTTNMLIKNFSLRLRDIQMPFVDIIIYSFHYLLDPKVAEQVSKELSKDAIVVFDEAHNIGLMLLYVCNSFTKLLVRYLDNVCIESLSIDLTRPMLDSAGRSAVRLGDKIEEYVSSCMTNYVRFLTFDKELRSRMLQNCKMNTRNWWKV